MKSLLLFILLSFSFSVMGQKLPDVQNVAYVIDKGVKIDGKNVEWGNTYQAENKKTLLKYSVANDDKYLYFIFNTSNKSNIRKIINGGISVTINVDGKRNIKDAFVLSYPYKRPITTASSSERSIGAMGGASSTINSRVVTGGPTNSNGSRPPNRAGGTRQNLSPEQMQARTDSLNLVSYKRQLQTYKEIQIEGFKHILDSTLSIYNTYGIKAAANFDDKGDYVYELAIPLSQLGINDLAQVDLMYQIRVNSILSSTSSFSGVGNGGMVSMVVISSGGGGRGGNSLAEVDLYNPAEFWAKYPLKIKSK